MTAVPKSIETVFGALTTKVDQLAVSVQQIIARLFAGSVPVVPLCAPSAATDVVEPYRAQVNTDTSSA